MHQPTSHATRNQYSSGFHRLGLPLTPSVHWSQLSNHGRRHSEPLRLSLKRSHVYCDRTFHSRALRWFMAERARTNIHTAPDHQAGTRDTRRGEDIANPPQGAKAEREELDGSQPHKRRKLDPMAKPIRKQPARAAKQKALEQSAKNKASLKKSSVKSNNKMLPQLLIPGSGPSLVSNSSERRGDVSLGNDTQLPYTLPSDLRATPPVDFIYQLRLAVDTAACSQRVARGLPDPGHVRGHDLLLCPAIPPGVTVVEQLRQLEVRRLAYPAAHVRPFYCVADVGLAACGWAEDEGLCLHGAAMQGVQIVDGEVKRRWGRSTTYAMVVREAEMLPSPSLGRWPECAHLPMEDTSLGLVEIFGLRFIVDVCEPVTRIMMA